MARGFAKLHTAANTAPRAAREDPELLCDHILKVCLPDGGPGVAGAGSGRAAGPSGRATGEDIVLMAVRFE